MAVSGPAISGEVQYGVFITYVVDAIRCIAIYLLFVKINIHPSQSISVCIAMGCIGFLFMFASSYAPALAPFACGLIGLGMIPCQMIPLLNVVLMKRYPARYFSSLSISLALAAVLVQSAMVEVFREAPEFLILTYALIMAVLVILYLLIAPFLLHTMNQTENEMVQTESTAISPLSVLTKREIEVMDLIAYGYSNSDIAKILVISEHTVKDHTKHIYKKLDVHSRFELAALLNRIKEC